MERDTVVNFSREKIRQKTFIPDVALGVVSLMPAVACIGRLKHHPTCHAMCSLACNVASLPAVDPYIACHDISNLGLLGVISWPSPLRTAMLRCKLSEHFFSFSTDVFSAPRRVLATELMIQTIYTCGINE